MVGSEKKKYKATRGAPFSNETAQIYGECIDSIMKVKGGARPIDVLNEAEDEFSPLHDYFVWDDELASAKYRIGQARQLISQVVKIKVTVGGKKIEQRAFLNVSVVTEDSNEPMYVTVERALSDDEFRAQILMRAMKEIEYWTQKYKDFKELVPIFETREAVEEAIRLEESLKKQQKEERGAMVGTFKEPSSC